MLKELPVDKNLTWDTAKDKGLEWKFDAIYDRQAPLIAMKDIIDMVENKGYKLGESILKATDEMYGIYVPVKKPKIIIVDSNDRIIGTKYREELAQNDIYRVTGLWLTNSKGEILLARRHHSKSHDPLIWGPAVGGTVDEGETYEENIIKEAEEELGLKNIKPKLGPKIKVDYKWHFFSQWYTYKIDKPIKEFVIQETEVEEIKWISLPKLKILLQNNPEEYIQTMPKVIELFKNI